MKLKWKQVHKAGSIWTVKAQSHSLLCCVCLGQSPGLVQTLWEIHKAWLPLLSQSEFWLPDRTVCVLKEMYGQESVPSLSQHCRGGMFCVSSLCVSSYSPFIKDLGTVCVFLSPGLPWLVVCSCHHTRPSQPYTRAALSAENNNTMLVNTMYNHGENYKEEM